MRRGSSRHSCFIAALYRTEAAACRIRYSTFTRTPMIAMTSSRRMGSRTPLTQWSSELPHLVHGSCILSVVGRHISGPPSCVFVTSRGCQPTSPARRGRLTRLLRLTAHERGTCFGWAEEDSAISHLSFAPYHPRCVPGYVFLGGQTAAPHHLSGPPPPATAVPEIGVTVAPKVSIPAASSAIASNVFMFHSLSVDC